MSTLAHLRSPAPPWVALLELAAGQTPDALGDAFPGLLVARIDGTRCRTKPALLAEFARALEFPAYFGRNWDALEECLTDLGWLPARGYVLVVTDADRLLWRRPTEYRTFIGILEAAAREWAGPHSEGRAPVPFHTLLAVPAGRRARGAHQRLPRINSGGNMS